MTTDKLGRRTILLPCQTLLVVILFTVGGLNYSGATTGNAGAGTALVSDPSSRMTMILIVSACHLLSLDILIPGYRHVAVCLLGGAPFCPFEE